MAYLRIFTHLSILAGLALSIYATVVKVASTNDPDYVPHCDISEEVSCSKVMHSEYGNMISYMGLVPEGSLLDQPNSLYGSLFYVASAVVSCIPTVTADRLLLLLAIVSTLISAGLAYIMHFWIGALCIVCVGSYVCNISFLIGAWLLYRKSADRVRKDRNSTKKQK